MAYRAAVLGASGFTGAELLRLAAGHPDLEVVAVTAAANAGRRVADLYPGLGDAYGDLAYGPTDAAAVAGLDVVFCALPHGESQRIVPALVDRVAHVVDLGADFRLPAASYEAWYGAPHAAPELVDRFVFGLPELFRPDVTAADHVANPGCYPTATVLALAPLLERGLVEPTGIVVSAASGVSGAGRTAKDANLFAQVDGNFAAYGLLTHRHTVEIELALARVAGGPVEVLFQPHLAPMVRGILATCFARPSRPGLSTARLLAEYRDAYRDEPFVRVLDEPPSTKATTGSNAVHLTVRLDDRTGTVLAIAAEDNLVKGASGQAIQNANLLLGLTEGAGLSTTGLAP